MPGVRVVKVIVAPPFKIIDGTWACSTASVKTLRNRGIHLKDLAYAQW
jgi:hypothetical protein